MSNDARHIRPRAWRHPAHAQRILVYGVTGSGKSTLAAAISERTGIPWHAVDELTWKPDWIAISEAEQKCLITTICAQHEWILDAAYSSWLDVVLARAELVVCLDYPRWLSLSRLIRRTMIRVIGKQPVCNGNIETIRSTLSRDSIIAWHFHSFPRKRQRMRHWASSAAGPRVVLLTSQRDTDRWLDQQFARPECQSGL